MSTVLDRGEKGRQAKRRAPRGTLFALVSHTSRSQLRSVLIWGAALGLYSAAMVASFTAIEGGADELNQLMEAYPKGMLEAFGITDLGDPLPRWQLVAGNFIATALSLLGVCAVVGLLIWGTAFLVDVDLSLRQITNGVLNLWPICAVFGALALLCSALFHRRALAISIPAFLLFGMYLIDAIGR